MKFDFEYEVKKDDEGLLIKELLKRERGVSAKLMQKIRYSDGGIFRNGKPAILIDPVNAADLIQVKYPEGKSNFDPEPIPINVVYEDDSFLAINKQPGVVIYPTKGQPNHTLANGIMKYMLDKGDAYKIRFINRLDMNTSGLILVGKNAYVQNQFITQGQQGGIKKIYRAIVCGIIEEEEGMIDLPIGKAEDNIKRIVKEDGSPSVTGYKVLERFEEGYSYVELDLITGRTHQIRVHMSHTGHPVVGDELYGGARPLLIDRQALHAVKLTFSHPVSGKKLNLEAPVPTDMENVLKKLKNNGNEF